MVSLKPLAFALIAGCCGVARTTIAGGQQDLIQLLESRKCPACQLNDVDLTHADLRNADLKGAQLQRANLSQARLEGADLSGSDLSFTSLQGAILRGTDLRNSRLIGTDLNIGLLYIMAVTSISVVGILMSGWASNSKWSLFGGMRSAAQIVSYEIPTGLAVLPAVLLAGTMSTQGIIAAQGPWPWDWYIFHSPMMFVLFFVYFIFCI